jgi:hypothetical protein
MHKKNVVGKLKGKRSLVRPRCRLVDNIEMDAKEIGFEVDSHGSEWCEEVVSVEHGNTNSGSFKRRRIS